MKTQDQIINGIHAVNAMEVARDLRFGSHLKLAKRNGKLVYTNN